MRPLPILATSSPVSATFTAAPSTRWRINFIFVDWLRARLPLGVKVQIFGPPAVSFSMHSPPEPHDAEEPKMFQKRVNMNL